MTGSLALSIVIIICVCKFSATVTGRQTPWSIQGPKAWSVLYNNSNYGKFQLNNGVGQTPQMGWNSWNFFACAINETVIRETGRFNNILFYIGSFRAISVKGPVKNTFASHFICSIGGFRVI
jgi:hypothetical protein